MTPAAPRVADIHAELVAVVMTVDAGLPYVLASGDPAHLPSGPLRQDDNSLQAGVRTFAREQTGHNLGFVEQLYTFADLGRPGARAAANAERVVSISYLGLTRAGVDDGWLGVYDALPWEDQRTTTAARESLTKLLAPWADSTERRSRVDLLLGNDDQPWRPDFALQRYELLWEAGLVGESGGAGAHPSYDTGVVLHADHRRILATGLSRLRAKLQYRPVVFELMPETFTLGQLQDVVEAVAGQAVHKQNFRRAVEHQHALVEPTNDLTRSTGGRPARLYRFRRDVLDERQQAGTKLPIPRSR